MTTKKLLFYAIIFLSILVANCKKEEEIMKFSSNKTKDLKEKEIIVQVVKKWYPWIELEDPEAEIHIRPAEQLFLTNFSIYAVNIEVDMDPPMETKYVAVSKDRTTAFFLSDRNNEAFINLYNMEEFRIRDSHSGCQVAEAYLLWCSEGEMIVTSNQQLKEVISKEVYAEIKESLATQEISPLQEPTVIKTEKGGILRFTTWNPLGLLELWSFNLTEEGIIKSIDSKEIVDITHLLGIE